MIKNKLKNRLKIRIKKQKDGIFKKIKNQNKKNKKMEFNPF